MPVETGPRGVRPATAADLPRLVAMGTVFLGTVYRGLIQADADALTRLATRLLGGPASTILVAERNGTVIGMIGLLCFAHPMSGAWIASEVMWWVDPAARGCGLRLLRAGEEWAIAQGATALQMIAPTPDVERLYDRLGFTPIERTYQRPL